MTDVPDVPDVDSTLDANEADVLEQASPVDEHDSGEDLAAVDDRLLEANEADLLEQSLTVPSSEDDDLI